MPHSKYARHPPETKLNGPQFYVHMDQGRTENSVKNHFQKAYKEAFTLFELNTHRHQDPVASASNRKRKWRCCIAIATKGGKALVDWAKKQDFVKDAVASVTASTPISTPIMMAGGLAVVGGATFLHLTGLLEGQRALDLEDIKKAMRECLEDHERENLIKSLYWFSNQVCRVIPGITDGADRFAALKFAQDKLDKIRRKMETHLKGNNWESKHARLFEAWSHIVDLRLMVFLNMTQIMNQEGIPRFPVNAYEAQRKLHEDTLQDLHLKYMVYRISRLEMLKATQMIIDMHTERYIHMQGNTKIYENAPGQIVEGKVADLLEVYIRSVASDTALWLKGTRILYWPANYASESPKVVKSRSFVYYMPKIYEYRDEGKDYVSDGAFAVKWCEGEKPKKLLGPVGLFEPDLTQAQKFFSERYCSERARQEAAIAESVAEALAEAEASRASRALAEAEASRASRALAEAEALRASRALAEMSSSPPPGSTHDNPRLGPSGPTSTQPPLVPHCSAELNGHSATARVRSSRNSATARVLLFLLLSSAIVKCLWPQLKQKL